MAGINPAMTGWDSVLCGLAGAASLENFIF
jgi:hypothetical protein